MSSKTPFCEYFGNEVCESCNLRKNECFASLGVYFWCRICYSTMFVSYYSIAHLTKVEPKPFQISNGLLDYNGNDCFKVSFLPGSKIKPVSCSLPNLARPKLPTNLEFLNPPKVDNLERITPTLAFYDYPNMDTNNFIESYLFNVRKADPENCLVPRSAPDTGSLEHITPSLTFYDYPNMDSNSFINIYLMDGLRTYPTNGSTNIEPEVIVLSSDSEDPDKEDGDEKLGFLESQYLQNGSIRCTNPLCQAHIGYLESLSYPWIGKRICCKCYNEQNQDTIAFDTMRKCANDWCNNLRMTMSIHPDTKEYICRTCYDFCFNHPNSNRTEMRCSNLYCSRIFFQPFHISPVTGKHICSYCHGQFVQARLPQCPKKLCGNPICGKSLRRDIQHNRDPMTKKRLCYRCYHKLMKDKEKQIKDDRPPLMNSQCANIQCNATLKRTFRHPVTRERVCQTCLWYYKKYGRDRVPQKFKKRNMFKPASNS